MHISGQVSILLIRPQMGENIGAAARAMANFGLSDLRIVSPRDGWPNQKAIDMASGAFDIIPQPQIFESFDDAIKDLNKLYATTARPRDMVKPVYTPDAAIEDALPLLHSDGKVGFVFGPERTGIENEELSRCHAIINVPTNPDFSSLNLGQCVLLMAHAFSRVSIEANSKATPMGDSMPVSQDKLDEFLGRLEGELEAADFFKSDAIKPSMVKNIRNLFIRNDLSDQEVKTLHGVVTALVKKRKTS